MRLSRNQRNILSLVALVLLAGLWFWTQQGTDAGTDDPGGTDRRTSTGHDDFSGLEWIEVVDLPEEARETLDLIDDGGPYPYDRDGVVFENREGILPDRERGHYHEYTVPTPGEDDRGARRIVTGDEDEFYWTADHYSSFERIRR